MKKLLKFIGYLLAGLFALLLAAVMTLKLIPDEKYRDWITAAASTATGREVSIDRLELDFGAALRIRADNVRMANADWATREDMLHVNHLEADFGLLPLLNGTADIRAVVEQAEVLADYNADGVSNWAIVPPDPEPKAAEAESASREFSGLPLHPLIREIRIDDFKLTLTRKQGAAPETATIGHLLIETPNGDTTLSLSGDLNGRPIHLSGNLGDMQKFLTESSVAMSVSGDVNGSQLKLSGDWGPLLPEQYLRMDLSLKVPDIDRLAGMLGLQITELGQLDISGRLVGDGKRIALDPLTIGLDDPNLDIAITGAVDDLKHMSGIRIATAANTESLTKLLRQLGFELSFPLPPVMELDANIEGGLTHLQLTELIIVARDKGMEIRTTTSIDDLMHAKKINLAFNGAIDSLSVLNRYVQAELPETAPVSIEGSLNEERPELFNYTVRVDNGAARVDASGVLKGLAVPEKIEADVTIKADSLHDFDKLAQTSLPDEGPVDIKATVRYEPGRFAVKNLDARLDDQSIRGRLAVMLPQARTEPLAIEGKLDIPYLDLGFLLPAQDELPADETAQATEIAAAAPDKTEPATAGSDTTADRLFPDKPVLGEHLHKYNIDLTVHGDRIQLGKTDIKDLLIAVRLKDGLLEIDPIKGTGGAGRIDGVIRVDGRKDTPGMDLDISMLEVPAPNVGGKLDFDADLEGQGNSVAELMASLDGRVLMVLRDGRLESRFIKKFGAGLLSFSAEKGYTELECAILRIDVKDGIADFNNRLAAQLTEVTWRGGGVVNLKTEELEVGISPKPRRGIPISAGSLASLVHIGGTLKHPKVQLDPKDLALKYAKYSAHVATGGITLAVDAIKNRIQANQDVCRQILDGTVFEETDKARKKERDDDEGD